MDLAAVIQQLRANVPALGGRVAGAAEFAAGLEDEALMDLPAAYVVPLDESAAPNPPGSGLIQVFAERIAVIAEFPNSTDRRGQGATLQYDAMRTALWAALLNWRVDPVRAPQGFAYAGGRMLWFDRARLFYQWEFTLNLAVTDGDGWQPAELALAGIDAAVQLTPVPAPAPPPAPLPVKITVQG